MLRILASRFAAATALVLPKYFAHIALGRSLSSVQEIVKEGSGTIYTVVTIAVAVVCTAILFVVSYAAYKSLEVSTHDATLPLAYPVASPHSDPAPTIVRPFWQTY